MSCLLYYVTYVFFHSVAYSPTCLSKVLAVGLIVMYAFLTQKEIDVANRVTVISLCFVKCLVRVGKFNSIGPVSYVLAVIAVGSRV